MISPDQIARLAAQLGQDDDAAFAEAFAPIVAQVGEDAATAIWEGLVLGAGDDLIRTDPHLIQPGGSDRGSG